MPTCDTPSFRPAFHPEEWDLEPLWEAWNDGRAIWLAHALVEQWDTTPYDNHWEDFVAVFTTAVDYFGLMEDGTAEDADYSEEILERQVAQARYGFWKD